jgi:uncharacterized protein (TIRG00374 family)
MNTNKFNQSPAAAPRKPSRWVLFISIVLAGFFLFLALKNINWQKFILTVQSGHYQYFIFLLVWYSITCLLRALRWFLLLKTENGPTYLDVFWSNMVGYLGNNYLPARAGEFLRSFYLGRASGIGMSFVLATALTERVVDVVALVLVSAVCLLTFNSIPPQIYSIVQLMAFAGLAGLVVIFLLPRFEKLLGKIVQALPMMDTWKEKIIELLEQFLTGMRSLHNPGRAVIFLTLTAVIWLFDGLGAVIGVRIFDLQLSLAQALLFLAGLGLSSAIPSTPGYVGVYQFVAITVLGPFGIPEEKALAYILVSQVANYAVVTLYGLIGLFNLNRSKPTQ